MSSFPNLLSCYLFLSSLTTAVFAQTTTDGPLTFPRVLSNQDGIDLTIDLTLQEADHVTVAASQFHTRLIDGTMPGPTVRVNKGSVLTVNFKNELTQQDNTREDENDHSFPDSTNLHFHGPHITGEAPGDDTTLSVDPGESYTYQVEFQQDHMGGTHWIHPHRHGSGFQQVSGGAASVLIIEDDPGEVPDEVANAQEVILMAQLLDEDRQASIANRVRDNLHAFNRSDWIGPDVNGGDELLLVNGQYQPTLPMVVGEWQRWRVVFAGWSRRSLDLQLNSDNNCETHLLAKDGIYITDYPREIDNFRIVTGGRADLMVRCNVAGVYQATSYLGDFLEVVVTEPQIAVEPTELTTNFEFPRPAYLNDLRTVDPSPGCSCNTHMEDDVMAVNGLPFDKNLYLHTIAQGSIVERNVTGVDGHPYHQHVYPFQLVEFGGELNRGESEYFKIGDYHDSFLAGSINNVIIRYHAEDFATRMPVHCHRLTHSDEGMLTAEMVIDGGVCQCSPQFNATGFFRDGTAVATDLPTAFPTFGPTLSTTNLPTASPTFGPTAPPTASVTTTNPTATPTFGPTSPPTPSTPTSSITNSPTVSSTPSDFVVCNDNGEAVCEDLPINTRFNVLFGEGDDKYTLETDDKKYKNCQSMNGFGKNQLKKWCNADARVRKAVGYEDALPNGTVVKVYSLCPNTCNACADTCADETRRFDIGDKTNKKCPFMTDMGEATQIRFCKNKMAVLQRGEIPLQDQCARTCGLLGVGKCANFLSPNQACAVPQ